MPQVFHLGTKKGKALTRFTIETAAVISKSRSLLGLLAESPVPQEHGKISPVTIFVTTTEIQGSTLRYTRSPDTLYFCLHGAQWYSVVGTQEVCKTFIHRFDSDRRLQSQPQPFNKLAKQSTMVHCGGMCRNSFKLCKSPGITTIRLTPSRALSR